MTVKSILFSISLVLASFNVQAATYCGWIDDAKMGANLTDATGMHGLSDPADQKSADLSVQLTQEMKTWPSCGCVTGKLNKYGDFATITKYVFKPIEACKSDKKLPQY